MPKEVSRTSKGKRELFRVTKVNSFYIVENLTKGTKYTVTPVLPLYSYICTCEAFRYQGYCKHIQVVDDLIREEKHMQIARERTEDLMELD